MASELSSSSCLIDRSLATLAFDEEVTRVPQVSASRAGKLGRIGIRKVRELVTHYPRRYLDLSRVSTIADAPIGDFCTIAGEVYDIRLKRPRPKLDLVELTLIDETDSLIVTCFRQPWLMDRLAAGMTIAVAGKVEFSYGMKRMTNPFIEELGEEKAQGQVAPIHRATESISAAWMRRLIQNALRLCAGIEDPLPLELRERYRLMSRGAALRSIHFPQTMDELNEARRRLVYEELLLLQLYLMSGEQAIVAGAAPHSHVIDGPRLEALRAAIPFTLTDEQVRARDEMLFALAKPSCAHHLLLGDVGSGKTIVAAFALAAAADSGSQALMMAPTEVLARQYASSLGPLFDAAGIRHGLLTGSLTPSERATLLEAAAAGRIDVLFGTHALIEPDVVLPQVSLVVIDEQQRFGVEQQDELRRKGEACDVLSLTATPIPRSLTLTLFGSMTTSFLPSITHGRRSTVVLDREQEGVAYDAIRAALERGEQAYVVCPLVGTSSPRPQEDGELQGEHDEEALAEGFVAIEDEQDYGSANLHAAEEHQGFLARKVFPDAVVGLLHGKMSGEEKRQVMEDFRRGAIDVLVCTTIIEVGIDVPNATVMAVENAERFGLAQLHQLRGRVGRGDKPGQIFLISSSRAPVAQKRLEAMERIDDGFELSEYDLSLRHEGDILGNRQHGASSLKLVKVLEDGAIIECAHRDARAIIEADPGLEAPAHRALARELSMVFGWTTEHASPAGARA